MLDVQKLIILAMKKEIFNSSPEINKAGRTVLAEIKTKQKDIVGEISSDIQYKILTKMNNDRLKSISIYSNELEKNPSNELAKSNFETERNEALVCSELLKELESSMPKKLTECEIIEKISELKENNSEIKIGDVMKAFKDINADKAIIAKICKEIL
jgi:uncharacterized protein YqeY